MRKITILLAMLIVWGCSGSGNSPSAPAPVIENIPPRVQFPLLNEVNEGIQGVAFTFTSTDGNRDQREHTLSGEDASFFELSEPRYDGTRADLDLIFRQALDFEKPEDADGDGTYEVTVTVTDGQDSHSINGEIVIGNIDWRETPTSVASGYAPLIETLVVDHNSDQFDKGYILVERAGVVHYARNLLDGNAGNDTTVVMLDLTSEINSLASEGILGAAVSPEFSTDGYVYFSLVNAAGKIEIQRYTLDQTNSELLNPASKTLIMRIDEQQTDNFGGWIGFSLDGDLVVAVGDGSISNTAQDAFSLRGKILKIDVTIDDFPGDPDRSYGIPADNPFNDGVSGAQEVLALGVRNPTGGSIDKTTGEIFFTDNGESLREEVNRLGVTGSATNFGWPIYEGNVLLAGTSTTEFAPPILEYTHGTNGSAITAGIKFDSNEESYFLFGDKQTGNVWLLQLDILDDGETVTADAFETSDIRGPVKSRIGIPGISNFADTGRFTAVTQTGELYIYEAPLPL